MRVDKQNELMSDLLFTVHQHGGDDVNVKTTYYTRRRLLAQQRCNIVATLFPIVTTLFQHCNGCAKNRRCESSRVTSP